MKKIAKIVCTAGGAIIVIASIYYTAMTIKARIDTPRIIQKALHTDTIQLESSDLNSWQVKALLAVEDPNFFGHKGIDLKTSGAGLTTITQSLVKIYYFDSFKPGLAKIKQTLIARFALDPLVSKDDQLKLFINSVYLGNMEGNPVYGFKNAARAYYHKQIHELSEDEYLSIVAMIVAPRSFHIIERPKANAERTRRIKKVVSGEYKPKSWMDIYYGPLDEETQKWLAPASYFPSLYKN